MSAGKKRARAISSDEAMPQIKMPRLENGDGRHNKNRAELSFSTSGISGNATVQNAGGHIINGDYTVHRTLSTDDNPKIKQKSEVMKWIYTVDSDTSLSYNAAQKVHLSGTGSWFLDGSHFVQWKEQPGSLLWLYGGLYFIAGCGKTVLSCGYFSPHPREILSDFSLATLPLPMSSASAT
ncbi:hypothetical protein FIBSPDRAFT_899753 [Athelia psychrophila]|uniref:Nephrocystin 3-like N-terminal domain-containing protein n=1 Tax=Athelia psychrophila TaxID=1759441 RepID=A0A165ZB61_9AGAM|nr:hypothetical protein FIBSPDRAFT_899753 [Fibularhizoctonia sp. CBS 109695]